MAKYMLSLRCWALLHYPGLTDLEDDLALLMADKDSSELDAELHMRILQHYSNVRPVSPWLTDSKDVTEQMADWKLSSSPPRPAAWIA